MQVLSIVRHTRPDRQTLLFSATLPPKLRGLVRTALTNPLNVTVGATGAANADVQQSVLLMASGAQKLQWLQARLRGFVDDGDVLVFANKRATVEAVAGMIKVPCYLLAHWSGSLRPHGLEHFLLCFSTCPLLLALRRLPAAPLLPRICGER